MAKRPPHLSTSHILHTQNTTSLQPLHTLHASLTHLIGKDSSDRPVYWSHMKVLILQIPGHSGDFPSHTHLGELVEDVEEDMGLLGR